MHHHANAVEKRVGDGKGARAEWSLRSVVGTAQRAPSATRGGATDYEKSTSGGWNVLSRSEAVAALRLMVGSSGRDPMQFALHSGRIGGATQLAAQGLSGLQIQRAGRWKSRAFMTYVREAGEGAEAVSTALAQSV